MLNRLFGVTLWCKTLVLWKDKVTQSCQLISWLVQETHTSHPITRMILTKQNTAITKNNMNKKAVLSQRWPRDARYISRSWGVAEIWPFEIIHLELIWIENSAIRSAVPENTTRTKLEVDRITRCRDMAIRVCWGIWNPHMAGRWGRRESAMAPLERAMVVSYRLSIVTVALSVTIRPQFAIECLRRSNQQRVGHFGPKFRCVRLGADPSCSSCKERTSQAN